MKWLLLIVVVMGIWSCSDGNTVPKKIIPQKQMENILWDMTQADQFAVQYLKKDSLRLNFRDETMNLYNEIFAIHHISREEFKRSFDYYTGRPDLTKTMFDSLFARGSRQRADIFKHPTRIPNPVLKVAN